MSLQSLFRRRPSAAMLVSITALFVALGGVGWAASSLPAGSVGSAQLRNGSVTNWKIANGAVGNWKLAFDSVGARKIINGAVGANQVNQSQVQLRVANSCNTGAIDAISRSGAVTCNSTPPNEYGTSSNSVTLSSGNTQIASKQLPGGSPYLVLAYPHAVINGASGEQVEVDCTLAVSPGNGSTLTRSLVVQLNDSSQAATIPLVVPAPAVTDGSTATVSCTDSYSGAAPTVSVASTVNAIQTASNG